MLKYRERSLIERGYDENFIVSISEFSEDEVNNVAMKIFKEISINCDVTDKPRCIFVGGQPGSGKSTRIDEITNNFSSNIIVVDMDLYRSYHPKYEWIIDAINKHWKNREITSDDSPGNDLADFTHQFAGKVSDKLVDLASEIINGEAYNMVIEWGMRKPDMPLETINKLHEKGYYVEVVFIAVKKEESLQSCNYRDSQTDSDIIRRVSKTFHDLCIKELPVSAKTIFNEGTSKGIINSFKLVDRNNNVLWDKNSNEDLYEVYYNYLNQDL